MTIALGLQCVDGLVLCADSLETDGVSKRYVDKLWTYEVQDDWGIAIASAGEADLADSFNDGLKDILGNSDFDESRLLSKLKTAIRSVRLSYPDSEFGFLAAVYGRPALYKKLFRVMDQSSHLGPIRRYQALGIGGALATFLASQMFNASMCVEEGVRLATFILAQVKASTDRCGGATSVLSYGGIGYNGTHFRVRSRAEISDIEKELSGEKLRDALNKFWRENNPAPTFPPIRDPELGGESRWIRKAKLNTMP
jgi:20S proteasome alpha/beta subunit